MPDTPFFSTEILPVNAIGIPGHTGGFTHPNRNSRIVVNSDDNTVLGFLDKDQGFMTNQALDDQVRNVSTENQLASLRTLHKVHFGGRETELCYIFSIHALTHFGFRFEYTIRIRNSYDLSVNNHILVGLQVSHEALTDTSWFVPIIPVLEWKLGRYAAPYSGSIRLALAEAAGRTRRAATRYRALHFIEATNNDMNVLGDNLNLSSYHLRRHMTQTDNTAMGLVLNAGRLIQHSTGTGKSSSTALDFRKTQKFHTSVQEIFNDRITEILNNEDHNENTNDNRSTDGGDTVAGDAPTLDGPAPYIAVHHGTAF